MKFNFLLSFMLFFCIKTISAQTISFSGPTSPVASGTVVTFLAIGENSSKYIGSVPTYGSTNYYVGGSGLTCPLVNTYYFATTNQPGRFEYKLENTTNTAKTVKIAFPVTIITIVNNQLKVSQQIIDYTLTVLPIVTPTVYGNAAISFVFNKNDCSMSSQEGNPVTYSIAAGTYTSTISQADADEHARYSLFFFGQNYANANGTCFVNPNKIITYFDLPQFSDTFEIDMRWNQSRISSPTVSFELFQYGISKGIVAANIPNNGATILNIIQYLKQDGHTFRNVRLKIISDANPNQFEISSGYDWFVD